MERPPPHDIDLEGQTTQPLQLEVKVVNFSKRAQWLRAAVLGAIDGLLSTMLLMMDVAAVHKDAKTMVITVVAGLIGGSSLMAIGELVSAYSQYDIGMAQIKREDRNGALGSKEVDARKGKMPSPWQAAGASALAFAVGALLPLATVFVKGYKARLAVVIAVVTVALVGLGWLSAVLGKAPVLKSASRVLVGGWLALGIAFGLNKLIGSLVSKNFEHL